MAGASAPAVPFLGHSFEQHLDVQSSHESLLTTLLWRWGLLPLLFFCGERTGWICHLLAGEYYDQAIHTNGVEKKTYLEQTAKYVECERKRFPSGFIQNDPPKVIPTEVLRGDVEQQLKELEAAHQR